MAIKRSKVSYKCVRYSFSSSSFCCCCCCCSATVLSLLWIKYVCVWVRKTVHLLCTHNTRSEAGGCVQEGAGSVCYNIHTTIFHIKSFENCENASLLRCNKTESRARERKNISSINLNFLLFDGEQYKMPYVYQTLIKYLMMYLCAASVYISKRSLRFDSDRAGSELCLP